MLAPSSLKKVHPLKIPVIEDNGMILVESGAILECLKATYDAEKLLHLEILGERVSMSVLAA